VTGAAADAAAFSTVTIKEAVKAGAVKCGRAVVRKPGSRADGRLQPRGKIVAAKLTSPRRIRHGRAKSETASSAVHGLSRTTVEDADREDHRFKSAGKLVNQQGKKLNFHVPVGSWLESPDQTPVAHEQTACCSRKSTRMGVSPAHRFATRANRRPGPCSLSGHPIALPPGTRRSTFCLLDSSFDVIGSGHAEHRTPKKNVESRTQNLDGDG
jgi:hypothetical protein